LPNILSARNTVSVATVSTGGEAALEHREATTGREGRTLNPSEEMLGATTDAGAFSDELEIDSACGLAAVRSLIKLRAGVEMPIRTVESISGGGA